LLEIHRRDELDKKLREEKETALRLKQNAIESSQKKKLKRLSNKVDEGALKTLETTINEAEKPAAEINVNPFKLADQQAKKKIRWKNS